MSKKIKLKNNNNAWDAGVCMHGSRWLSLFEPVNDVMGGRGPFLPPSDWRILPGLEKNLYGYACNW